MEVALHRPRLLLAAACLLPVLLSACSSADREKAPMTPVAHIKEARKARANGDIPADVKVGRPYHIKGVRYAPYYDPYYQEVGMASWYGPGFHGKSTANGEEYNQYDLTAAHRTLPLPSLVRVDNLENGRSLVVRVNDRGPYAKGRIIDLSKRAAELLGTKGQGVAKVRVTLLENETRQLWQTAGLRLPGNIPASSPAAPAMTLARAEYDTSPAAPAPMQVHKEVHRDAMPAHPAVPVRVAALENAEPTEPQRKLHWSVMVD